MDKLREAYRTLGIPVNSQLVIVRNAYRKLAKEYHPDSNPHDQHLSTSMMMKVNEAYQTIKWHLERGIKVEEYERKQRVRYPYEDMIRRWERERQQEEERRSREQERRRREAEAYDRFLDRVALERKHELDDRQYYDTITKYTGVLISFYYRNNLHIPHYRERSSGEGFFSEYLVRYDLLVSKSRKVEGMCKSKMYRRKSRKVSAFLRLFIEDARMLFPMGVERRAQALSIFQRALDSADRFMSRCFVEDGFDREEARELLERSLDEFEYFLRSYPQSPLVEHAQRRLGVLEGAYRSFMADSHMQP
ncbi:MAG TPA: J domain-containing protein [Spirochaetota bacterium]|nr:J domain-containing protein [Spirochaetota bacterium]